MSQIQRHSHALQLAYCLDSHRIRQSDKVAITITAATIAALRQLRRGRTKVVIMDRGDGRGIAVAKAFRDLGCRQSYTLKGGFR